MPAYFLVSLLNRRHNKHPGRGRNEQTYDKQNVRNYEARINKTAIDVTALQTPNFDLITAWACHRYSRVLRSTGCDVTHSKPKPTPFQEEQKHRCQKIILNYRRECSVWQKRFTCRLERGTKVRVYFRALKQSRTRRDPAFETWERGQRSSWRVAREPTLITFSTRVAKTS